jgi:hypothetical protein
MEAPNLRVQRVETCSLHAHSIERLQQSAFVSSRPRLICARSAHQIFSVEGRNAESSCSLYISREHLNQSMSMYCKLGAKNLRL